MRKSHGILLVISGGVAAVFLAIILLFSRIESSRQEVVAYRARLEAMAEKLRTEDLASATPAVSNESGREIITAAEELNKLINSKPFKPFLVGMAKAKPGTAEIAHLQAHALRANQDAPWAVLEESLSVYRDHLEKIALALRKQPPEIFQDYTQGHALYSRYVSPLLKAGQILGGGCVLDLRNGQTHEAVEKIRTILAMAELEGKQPTVIEQLVCAALIGMASHSTWEILQAPATEADLAALQKAWQQLAPKENLAPALRMELSWVAEVFKRRSPYAGSSKIPMSPSPSTSSATQYLERIKEEFRNHIGRYNDELTMLKGFQALIEVAESPAWNSAPLVVQNVSDSAKSFYLSKIILKGLAPTLEKIALTDTAQKLTITAIAIRRYQLEHSGELPSDLSALVPQYLSAIPRDIMDGAPLRYKRMESGYLLYGIGFDGVDDLGNPEAPAGKKYRSYLEGRDIVWPRPVLSQAPAPDPTPP